MTRIAKVGKRLELKKEKLIGQTEREEQIKETIQHTQEEIEQLEYCMRQVQRAKETNRKPRVIAYEKVRECFAILSRMYDYVQRHVKQTIKYELACEVIYARYKFKSRSNVSGQEFLCYATVLAYFKRERGMVNA